MIHSAAILRAKNFRIPEWHSLRTKLTAGKIRPEIITTTAMTSGVVAAEIYKFAQNLTDLTIFKNSMINLAQPSFIFMEPMAAKIEKSVEYDPDFNCPIKAIPDSFTIHDKITIKEGSLTLRKLISWFKENFGVKIEFVCVGPYSVYNSYIKRNEQAEKLDYSVE